MTSSLEIRSLSDLKELPDWSGAMVILSNLYTMREIDRFFGDPRLETLDGLRVCSDWKGRIFGALRAHYAQLSNLECLDVMLMISSPGALPIRELLDAFPGITTFKLQGIGEIEPARHGFVRDLVVSTRLRTQPLTDGGWVNLNKLEVLNACVFPALENLTLGFQGDSTASTNREVIQTYLPPILAGEPFPKLKRLDLRCVLDRWLAEHFTKILLQCDRVAPNLECLGLTKGLFEEPIFRLRLKQWKPYLEGRVDLEIDSI